MSLLTGNVKENSDLKFLELRKYSFKCNSNDGINLLSCDNNRRNVFICSHNRLFVVKLHDLLNFEWNKSVINEVLENDQFAHLDIDLPIIPHLISSSANGYGNKLAICGRENANSAPIILFYDLNDINPNSSPFSRVNLTNCSGLVTDIVWHPEMCDNQFACTVSDGSVFVISISDPQFNTTSILTQMPASFGANCLCWSPKGKQIVIGYNNGHFCQFKHINGQQLQEVKKTVPPINLSNHKIVSIKWIVSSLFVAAYCNRQSDCDADSRVVIVSTPSKAAPQWVDYGRVCMDSDDADSSYKLNLLFYGNIILCTSSLSSEVAIIGCLSNEINTASPFNWSQWMCDDNSRIELPMDKEGNESFPRGMTILRGTEKRFKISESEIYGGDNCPILLIYSSSGILSPYLVIHKSNGLVIPEVPNVTKQITPQSKDSQLLPKIVSQPKAPQPQTVTPTIMPSIQRPILNPNLGTVNSGTGLPPNYPLSTSMSPFTETRKKTSEEMKHSFASSTPITVSQPSVQQLPFNAISKPESVPKTDPPLIIPSKTQHPQSASSNTDAFSIAINEEIKEFKNEFLGSKKRVSQINLEIGTSEEKQRLRSDTRILEEVSEQLKDQYRNFTFDVNTLNASLLESFSTVEEAKSLIDRDTDPRYRNLLKQRSLDPTTARRMEEIKKLNQYIDLQLRELNSKFDEEWNQWLERRKTKPGLALSSNCELIYKNLSNNQRIIANLRAEFERLESVGRIPKLSQNIKSLNQKKRDIEKLSISLTKTSINDNENDDPFDGKPLFRLKTISPEKKLRLKEFLESRQKVPIRRSVEIVDCHSSRFISALSKIKEQTKMMNISIDGDENIRDQILNEKPKDASMMNTENLKIIQSQSTPMTKHQKSSAINLSSVQSQTSKVEDSITDLTQKLNVPIKSQTQFAKPKGIFSPLNIEDPKSTVQSMIPFTTSNMSKPSLGTVQTSNESNVLKSMLTSDSSLLKPIYSPISEVKSSDQMPANFTTSSTTITSKPIPVKVPASNAPLTTTKSLTTSAFTSVNTVSIVQSKPSPVSVFTSPIGTSSSVSLTTVSTKSIGSVITSPLPITSLNAPVTASETTSSFTSMFGPKSVNDQIKIGVTAPSVTTTPSSIFGASIVSSSEQKSPFITAATTTETTSDITSVIVTTSISTVLTSAVTTANKDTTVTTSTVTSPLSSTPLIESKKENASQSPSLLFGTPQKQESALTFGQSQSAFGKSPFTTNTFNFGNVPSPATSSSGTAFGQGLAFGTSSSGFGNQSASPSPPAASTVSPFNQQLTQQHQTLSNLSFCGLGGAPSPENANKNVFGVSSFGSNPSPQTNLFGGTPQISSFGTSNSGAFSSDTKVGQTGFSAFQQSPQPTFGGTALFGGSPQPVFGGTATFGSGATPAFGGSPTFGGSATFGAMASATGVQSQQNPSFSGGFTAAANSSLTFGAIASSQNQPQSAFASQSAFGAHNYDANQSQGFGFGNASSSFTQRRK